jgi:hypothetical protein
MADISNLIFSKGNNRVQNIGYAITPTVATSPALPVSQSNNTQSNFPAGSSNNTTQYYCGEFTLSLTLNSPKWELQEFKDNKWQVVASQITTNKYTINTTNYGQKVYRAVGQDLQNRYGNFYYNFPPFYVGACVIPSIGRQPVDSNSQTIQVQFTQGKAIPQIQLVGNTVPNGVGGTLSFSDGQNLVLYRGVFLGGNFTPNNATLDSNATIGAVNGILNPDDYTQNGQNVSLPNLIVKITIATSIQPPINSSAQPSTNIAQSPTDGGSNLGTTNYSYGNGYLLFKPNPQNQNGVTYDVFELVNGLEIYLGSHGGNTGSMGDAGFELDRYTSMGNHTYRIYAKLNNQYSQTALQISFNRVARADLYTQNRFDAYKTQNVASHWTNYWSGASAYTMAYDTSKDAGQLRWYNNHLMYYFGYKYGYFADAQVKTYLDKCLSELDTNYYLKDRNLLNGQLVDQDSDDSYFTVYTALMELYLNRTNDNNWYYANISKIKAWGKVAILDQQVNNGLIKVFRNGLTPTGASYPVLFVGDNCENWKGSDAMANILYKYQDGQYQTWRTCADKILNALDTICFDTANNKWYIAMDYTTNAWLGYPDCYYPVRWVQTKAIVWDVPVVQNKKDAGLNNALTEQNYQTKDWFNAYAYIVANGTLPPPTSNYWSASTINGVKADPYPQMLLALALAKNKMPNEARAMVSNINAKWHIGNAPKEYFTCYDASLSRAIDTITR